MPTTIISDKFLDKDGFWKFTVSFDYGNWAQQNTYWYVTEAEVDTELSKATVSKDSLTNENMKDFKFENNVTK